MESLQNSLGRLSAEITADERVGEGGVFVRNFSSPVDDGRVIALGNPDEPQRFGICDREADGVDYRLTRLGKVAASPVRVAEVAKGRLVGRVDFDGCE